MAKKANNDFERLPKRVQAIIAKCRAGERLCKQLHHKETNECELTFTFEPSGKRAGPKSAAQAIETAFLRPAGDGLLGNDSSQTFLAT
jgi:hypothetical protein